MSKKDLDGLVEADLLGKISKEELLFLEAHLDEWAHALASKVSAIDSRLAALKAELPGRVSKEKYQHHLAERAEFVKVKAQISGRLREVKKKAHDKRLHRLETKLAKKKDDAETPSKRTLNDELVTEIRAFNAGQGAIAAELRRLNSATNQILGELRIIRAQFEFNSSIKEIPSESTSARNSNS